MIVVQIVYAVQFVVLYVFVMMAFHMAGGDEHGQSGQTHALFNMSFRFI